jgi:hypothetical protein
VSARKKNEFKLCLDSAKDVARLGALCVPVLNALLLFLLYHCAALPLRLIALHLHWIGHHHYTLNEKYNVRNKTNKRATASTNHIYSFLFILLLLLQLPRPFPPNHSQFRPPCHSHDGTAGLVVVCVCVFFGARSRALCTIDVYRFSQP